MESYLVRGPVRQDCWSDEYGVLRMNQALCMNQALNEAYSSANDGPARTRGRAEYR